MLQIENTFRDKAEWKIVLKKEARLAEILKSADGNKWTVLALATEETWFLLSLLTNLLKDRAEMCFVYADNIASVTKLDDGQPWVGKRASHGRTIPVGFPRSGKFNK